MLPVYINYGKHMDIEYCIEVIETLCRKVEYLEWRLND